MITPQIGDIVVYQCLAYEVARVDGDNLRLRGVRPQDSLTAPSSACRVIAQQVSMVAMVPMAEVER